MPKSEATNNTTTCPASRRSSGPADGNHCLWTKTVTQFVRSSTGGLRGSGMGEHVLHVRGDERQSERPPSKWKQQDQDAVEDETRLRERERCDAYCGQSSLQKNVNPDEAPQEQCNKHMLNPALALAAGLRRVKVWNDAGSSTGARRELLVVCPLQLR